MALRPIHGRAASRALAVEPGPGHEDALAAGLDPAVGRFEQDGEVAGEEVRLLGEHLAQPVELVAHLLALVERERDVVARRRRVVVHPLGQPQEHCEAALHVGRTQAVEHVAVEPGHLVAGVGGDGVEMPTEHDAPRAPELGTDDHVGAHAVDGERGRPRAQPRFDEIGELRFVVALRPHRDECRGEPEQIGGVDLEDRLGHVAAPWSRRMSLSFDLS